MKIEFNLIVAYIIAWIVFFITTKLVKYQKPFNSTEIMIMTYIAIYGNIDFIELDSSIKHISKILKKRPKLVRLKIKEIRNFLTYDSDIKEEILVKFAYELLAENSTVEEAAAINKALVKSLVNI